MAELNTNGKKKRSIHHKYRVSVINEDTFDEVRRVRLSLFNTMLFVGISLLIAGALVVSLIFYTPLKEYVPGYPDSETKMLMVENAETVDSLLVKLQQQEMYLEGIRQVLQGDFPEELYQDTSAERNKAVIMESVRLQATADEVAFRSQIEAEEQYNLGLFDRASEERKENLVYYTPVKGMITDHFNANKKHFGVDIATAKGEHISAIAAGTVLLVDYSMTSGNIISVQHANNVISTYRHASRIYKQAGDKVKAGEVIGIVGSTGTLSTGVHLHLEVWQDGEAIDPETLIVF